MSVSIGLPYTDQGELLGLAIRSVLNQSFENWELILIGDMPDNETRSIAHQFSDPRIRFYENPSRIGLAATLNRISALAKFSLVARMDGDDIMHPRRIELQKKKFDEVPSLDVLGTRAYLIDDYSQLAGLFKEPELPKSSAGYRKSNAFTHPTVMAKREWFLANPYDEKLLRGEDKELWLRTWSFSNFEKLPERLMYYRRPRSMPAIRMQRDEAYNRHILAKYGDDSRSSVTRAQGNLKSHAKEAFLGLIGNCGLSPVLFNTKWVALEDEEFLAASQVLAILKRTIRPNSELEVVAATVTYSDRYPLVERTVQAALAAGAARVIVVDNGSEEPSKSKLRKLGNSDTRVEVVALKNNKGSAVGFERAISAFLETSADYVWLLDDDNECEPQALNELLYTYKDIAPSQLNGPVGVCAIRPGNASHAAIARGAAASQVYPPDGSFMYFDILHRFAALLRKFKPRKQDQKNRSHATIPYAPYGGLLVGRESLDLVGLPKTELGLYEDDTEYTARFWKMGGKLVLCLGAVVNDIDAKWTEQEGHTGLAGLVHAKNSKRTYFAVRNRVAFDVDQCSSVDSFIRLKINEHVFRASLWICALRFGRVDQARQVSVAISAGLRQDLTRSFSDLEPH